MFDSNLYKGRFVRNYTCELRIKGAKWEVEYFSKYKMIKSKTKISKQTSNKTSKYLVSTIREAAKNPAWIEVAGILSRPKRNRMNANLSELAEAKDVIVCGKVLSEGDIGSKKKVVALNFSEGAKEKLLNAGCEVVTIIEEIKKNPEFKGLEIFKK